MPHFLHYAPGRTGLEGATVFSTSHVPNGKIYKCCRKAYSLFSWGGRTEQEMRKFPGCRSDMHVTSEFLLADGITCWPRRHPRTTCGPLPPRQAHL